MPEHALNDTSRNTSLPEGQPVAVAELSRIIVAALVGAGWLTLGTPVAAWITTGIGLALSVVFSWLAQRKVTPTADPRNRHGAPLAPVPTRRPFQG